MGKGRQEAALAVICLFPVLAAIFVALRSYSRYLGQNFGWDDWLIYLSLFLLLGETITSYQYTILSHTGYHVWEVPKQSVQEKILTLQWSWWVQLFYHPMMGAIRASIILFLFRVEDKRKIVQISLKTVFVVNILYMVSTSIVNVFQCTPVQYAWNEPKMDKTVDGKVVKGGKCIQSLPFILSSCAISIFMDLIIIPIPTAMVWNLHMRKKTKIAVAAIMSLGWIATLVTVVRFVVYYHRFAPTQKDKTYDLGLLASIAEPAVGIIAACAPAMKVLFRHLLPRYFSDSTTSEYDASGNRISKRTSTHPKSFGNNYGRASMRRDDRLTVLSREEQIYGMKPLGSVDSREKIVAATSAVPHRTRSVKTGTTTLSEEDVELEPMPKDC